MGKKATLKGSFLSIYRIKNYDKNKIIMREGK